MNQIKVAAIQTSPLFGEIRQNLHNAIGSIPGDCDLVVLPELFATGYQFHSRREALELAEPVAPDRECGPVTRRLSEVAANIKATIVAGVAEKYDDKIFNSSVLIRPDGSREVYRKVHLFMDEKSIFDPGDLGFPVFEACGTTIGMMICFDWVFPEAARSLALQGAQIICHPANLVLPWCPAAMITRCQENRVYAITANRVGREARTGDPLEFIGLSQVVDPAGTRLDQAPELAAGVAQATIVTNRFDKHMTPRNDLFADRRPDQYFQE